MVGEGCLSAIRKGKGVDVKNIRVLNGSQYLYFVVQIWSKYCGGFFQKTGKI
jgi:hypothetical protein